MPKVSVIIPMYNAEKFIAKCMETIFQQTYRDFEVIVVNDGSQDHSVSLLESMDTNGIYLHIISQENSGQAVARNVGIDKALGDFVCFVDIDDYVDVTMLEELVTKQEESNADIVWCDAYKVQNGNVVGTLDEEFTSTNNTVQDYLLHNAGPWRKLIRTTLIKENDLYFPAIRFYEDVAIVPTYAFYAKTIAYVSKPLYFYMFNDGSTMHQKAYSEKLECIFPAMECLLTKAKKAKGYASYQEELEFIVIDHLLHAASLRFFAFDKQEWLQEISIRMKTWYPKWNQNAYYTKQDWKYRFVCKCFYKQQYTLLKWILK